MPSNFKLSVSLTFFVYWHRNLSIWHEHTNCCQNKRAITLNLNKDSLIANHSGTCLQLENSLTIIGHVWFRQTQLLSWFWYRSSDFDLKIRFGLKRYFNYILVTSLSEAVFLIDTKTFRQKRRAKMSRFQRGGQGDNKSPQDHSWYWV